MNSNLLATFALVVAFATGALVFLHKPIETIVHDTREVPVAGSASSAVINSPFMEVGGVRTWHFTSDFRAGTSTACSFPTPAATSTVTAITAYLNPNLGYTTQWLWGDATTAFATTTALNTLWSVTNGANDGSIIASTTGAYIAYPNRFINLKLSTSSVGTSFAPTGTCHILFREI